MMGPGTQHASISGPRCVLPDPETEADSLQFNTGMAQLWPSSARPL